MAWLYRFAALGLAAVIALTAAAVGGYVSAIQWVDHTLEVRKNVNDWLVSVLEAETGARGFVVSGLEAQLEPYDAAVRRERALAATVSRLVADNPTQVANVGRAGRDAQRALDRLGDIVRLARTGHRDQAIVLVGSSDSRQIMNAFRDEAKQLRAVEDGLLVERRASALRRGLLVGSTAVLLMLVSCGLLAGGFRLRRRYDQDMRRLATEARQRLQALSDVAAALSESRTPAQVAAVVVEHGMRAAAADTCTVYTLDETGHALELIGERGVAPEIVAKVRRLADSDGNPLSWSTLRSGRSVWVESEAEYAALYPSLAATKAQGPRARAFWSVPLIVEGHAVGLLGMGFYQPRAFPPDERAFIETLAKQCGQSLLRASRLEREDEARRWFTTTLRSIGDAVIATDADGRITFMNPIAEGLTAWTESDARGRQLDEVFAIFAEDTGAVVESPVTKVLREGTVVGLANHTVLRARDGTELPIDDSGAPIRLEDGRLIGVVLVFRDATREKRDRVRRTFQAAAGEALVSSLDYEITLRTVARLAVPTMADWCAVDLVEPGSQAFYQAAVAHIDPTKVAFVKELRERYPPPTSSRSGAPEVIRTGKSELYEEIPPELLERGARDAEHLRLIHELRLRSAMVVPLRGRQRTLGALTFVYAESGRRYTQDDLAFAETFAGHAAMAIENAMALAEATAARAREHVLRGEAELASRAKDEFLAMVSHELRTPLNAILGWTVMLRGRTPPPEIDRGLAIIERNARSQTKLIEDVLDVSRIISGKLALSLAPTSIDDLISTAVETVTPAAAAKGITISTLEVDDGLTIVVDPDRVQQIAWNLLSNAVKFTGKGGQIAVRAAREGSDVVVSVRDTGEGIRPDVLPLIFEAFHQADATTTRRHGGLGLGLAIVKQLVAAHGGTVRAESEGEGRGATFTFRLPARAAIQAVSRSVPAPASYQVANAPGGQAPSLQGLRLLIVDDEQDALALVGEVLSEHGAEVYLAGSAADALDKLVVVRPDVIVSDIGMPDTDGYALIRKIRELPLDRGGRTPAVALTAYARADDVQRALTAGFQVHVAKPVEPGALAVVVAKLVRPA